MSDHRIIDNVSLAVTTDAESHLFGHPRGLVIIAATEFWDRISFHGMQALLVLYMAGQLLLPGHIEKIAGFAGFRHIIESVTGPLSTQALATQIFGIYVGLVNLTPIVGGFLGDRWLGRRRTVVLGGALMAMGHFTMAFDRSFLFALSLIIFGAGCLRGNLLSQVGLIYTHQGRRPEGGFQIYYAALNTGAFLAPLITGSLAQAYGWHVGFAFAGFGMLIGLAFYLRGRRYIPGHVPHALQVARSKLSLQDRRSVLVLCLMLPLLALFWVGQTQVWNTYNLWARDHLSLLLGGWTMPVPWLQAIDSLAAVVLVPPVILFWRWQAQRGREPDDFAKIATGCLIFAFGTVWLAMGSGVSNAAGKVPLVWALIFHFVYNIGYVYVAPIAVALYSRNAPASVNAMMISVYYLSTFAGSLVSGRLGSLYERVSPQRFWLIHAAIVGLGGVLIWLCAPRLRRELQSTLRTTSCA